MRSFFVALALCLVLPSMAKAADVPPLLTGVHRIVCLGDSITQGGEGPGGYVWLVRHYLNALYPQQPIEIGCTVSAFPRK